ncbi:MAG: tRNA pseudouridine synthase [Actinomycetota bacterium]
MGRRTPPTVHGLVILDKPAGFTSHDVVARLRKHFGERRIGHAGTLDPSATGVLLVGVGNGTRLMRFLEKMDKSYTCEIVFGVRTSTLDADGEVLAESEATVPSIEELRLLVSANLLGAIGQVPPMVSALKVDGKRLHQLAREGVEIERAARPVTVHAFDIEPTDDARVVRASVTCGSGTYVRSLGADLGDLAGCGAHIRNLRRTSVGLFTLADASTLDDPELHDPITAVRDMQRVTLDADGIENVLYGRPLPCWTGEGPWAILDEAHQLIAVYEKWKSDLAKPVVVFGGR